MHSELVRQFLGQYVAIYQGQVIDHDVDPVALHQRISTRYGGKVVLSRKVQKESKPLLHIYRTAKARQDARERFERHFATLNLFYPTGADNESIDADLARAYANEYEAH
jgi:hypothetical protein